MTFSKPLLILSLTILVCACASNPASLAASQAAPMLERIALEQSGDQGVHTWRIPALAVAKDGTLVAAYDARNDSSGDLPGNVDVVVRLSPDNGRTWSPLRRVVDFDGGDGGGDPSLLADHRTGRLFLFYAYGPQGIGMWQSNGDRNPDSRKAMHPHVIWSDDNGRTWQGPHNLIAEIKPEGSRGIFATSGHGIQLSRHSKYAGRLIQPYAWVDAANMLHAGNAISDDHGRTWRMGADIGAGLDENKAVELDDGRVMQNLRAFRDQTHRWVAHSTDGGDRFDKPFAEHQLPDPRNNGDIIRVHPDAKPGSAEARMLLFSNTADTAARRNLTVRLSCDSGRTWPVSKVLEPGLAMYSTMAMLDDGTVGILYENGNAAGITFARFNLAWLGEGC